MKKFLLILLWISFFSFGFDVYHMGYHLSHDSSLWNIPGVGFKLFLKIFALMIPMFLLLNRKSWLRFLILFFFVQAFLPATLEASSGCQHARELLKKSGVARDAKEGFFGKIKIKQPSGSFPEDMDRITWWGEFKPFEFWQSPKFQATWIDPEGVEVARHEFKGQACALAKTGVLGESQPRGQFKPGMWKVIVTCEDYLIDRQSFAVLPTTPVMQNTQESQNAEGDPVMIWAKDKV